jgi:antitoxin HigA-1
VFIASPKGAGPLKTIPTISAGTALRLSKYFGTTPEFWMNLQSRYKLEGALEEVGENLEEIEVPERAFG